MSSYTALVLAGSRGEGDPLAQAQSVRHRALLEVVGVPMLLRVLRTLRASQGVGRLVVSIDDPTAIEDVPEIAALARDGELAVHRSLASPSRSVLDALERFGTGEPVLVTTADHALLRRTYLSFRDEHYSGANLFAFRTPAARQAAAFWVRAESYRKRPWRLVSVFGPISLLLFLLRRLDLDTALARASKAIGARVEAVRLPFAEAAVDVDKPSDLELVTKLLKEG
jgi:GTP:adenosylcobinamide-phosphate guanylyltransferase